MASINIMSSTSRVETPFIIVKIGDYTFGNYSNTKTNVIDSTGQYSAMAVTYPNYMDSLSIVKVNGTVNTYTLRMKYAITQNDDPNLLEKVFSSVSESRSIYFTYGDYSIPSLIYKNEEALITDIKTSFDLSSSSITYTITAVSSSETLSAGSFTFGKRYCKPSDAIYDLLYNKSYGLTDIYYGMRDRNLVESNNLIATDDRPVTIEAKKSISVLDYLSYLVSCMSSISNTNTTTTNTGMYAITTIDDTSGIFGGPYFKVVKIAASGSDLTSYDTYEVDVGYPGDNIVTAFSIDDDQTYSILYNYSEKLSQPQYIYRINDEGNVDHTYSPTLTSSAGLMKTTESDKSWWSQVTEYPITASLTMKGLLRPAILMSYVKIRVMFYGNLHSSSGTYVITKQTETIDKSGYKTTLKLTRVSGYDN